MDYTKKTEELAADRKKFDDFVYTTLKEAIIELESRQNDKKLEEYENKILSGDVPAITRKRKSMVLFRHIATPNYEVRRFITAAADSGTLRPVIFEFTADKFNNRNDWKYSLGRVFLHKGSNKKGEKIFECKNIIDFNQSNNKPIFSVKTNWNQPLVDFHHEIFIKEFPGLKDNVFDLSDWLRKFGGSAKDYYKPFFTLFLKNGILFENFLLRGKELLFTKEIILPILMEIIEETGFKPLIVALEPTEVEGDQIWLAHPYHEKEFIEGKMNII